MNVAFDITPTENAHGLRGIGTYTRCLIEEFTKSHDDIAFKFFKNNTFPTDADLIHYPYFDLFYHSLSSNRIKPRIITIHDTIPLIFPSHFPTGIRGKINLLAQKMALKTVDAVICDSICSKKDIAKYLNFPDENIYPIHLAAKKVFKPIDVKDAKSFLLAFNLPKKFIIYVGDVNWNKNLENLIEAVKLSGVHIAMVGKSFADKNIPEVAILTNKILELKISDKVHILDYVEEEKLIKLYNLADATIAPSFYEGFGLSAIESMACGTPVICSNNSSLSEITAGHAIYCDPENPVNISKKITYVIGENIKSKIKSELTSFADTFSWKKTAEETINVYKKVSHEKQKI